MKRLIIIGASGHGKVIANTALLLGYNQVFFLDDNPLVSIISGFRIIGPSSMASKFKSTGYDFFVGIGNSIIREKLQKEIETLGCNVVTLIHPSAVVEYDVKIGKGSVVMAKAVVNAGTIIGDGCIINTAASIDYDNKIGNYSHVSVGVHTAESVSLGDRSWLGIGSTVSNNVSICPDCTIGAGAVVNNNIVENGIYIGVPARKVNFDRAKGINSIC